MNKAYAVIESPAYGADIRSFDPETQRNALTQAIENNPYFVLFYQQGNDGMQTARSSGELGSRADRWWFKQIQSEKQPFITKSYFSVGTNEAVTSVIYPVYPTGQSRTMSAVLGADLSLAKLQEIVDAYNTADTYSVILDGEGVVVAHPDTQQVSEMYNYKTGAKTVLVNGQETQSAIDLPASLQSLSAAVLSGESGVEESAAASEQLSAQAQALKTLVDGFTLRDSAESCSLILPLFLK